MRILSESERRRSEGQVDKLLTFPQFIRTEKSPLPAKSFLDFVILSENE